MARARAGTEIVIEGEGYPAVVLHAVEERLLRPLTEALRIARAHGSEVTLDGGFGKDLEAVIESHSEPLNSPWD
jgi:hypothetical protein